MIDRSGGVIWNSVRFKGVQKLHSTITWFQQFSTSTSPLFHAIPTTLLLYNLGSAHMARMKVKPNQDGVPQESPCPPANQVGMARHVKMSQNRIALKILNNYAYLCIHNRPRGSYDFRTPPTSFLSLKLHLISLHEPTIVFLYRHLN